MPTALQIKLIHVAAKQVRLNERQYRLLLGNVGGVESSKHLDNSGVEDVMAVLEDLGFRGRDGETYWRDKVARRGIFGNERMVRKVHALAGESRYQLPALCLRFSHHRTAMVDELDPREMWELIEMLKASNVREASTEEGLVWSRPFPESVPESVPDPSRKMVSDAEEELPF